MSDTDSQQLMSSIPVKYGDKRRWLAVIVLTLVIHTLLFVQTVQWNGPPLPHRYEIESIDSDKLKDIRKLWQDRGQLLLSKDKSKPTGQEEVPDQARYFSDRNIRVEKEQRAQKTNVIPSPNQIPKLKDMGVRYNLGKQKSSNLSIHRPQSSTDRSRNSDELQEGGDQSILDSNLPEGGENLLNARESVYYSFYARVYEALGPIWQSQIREKGPHQRALHEGEYVTIVDFILDREGNLIGVNQLRSSNVPEFDSAAHSALNRVKRFPHPPPGLLNEQGEIHMVYSFTVKLDQGVGFQFLPPERYN